MVKTDYSSYIGLKFGSITIIGHEGFDKKGNGIVKCVCDCGNIKTFPLVQLKSGHTKTCKNCCKNNFIIIGDLLIGHINCYKSSRGLFREAKVFILDAENYEKTKSHTWRYTGKYISTNINCKTVFLHRLIIDVPEGREIDHINGNPMDNRKSNLRLCTRSENQSNKISRKDSTCYYPGVYWNKNAKAWAAQIRKNNVKKHLGYYENVNDAIKARIEAEKEYHGKFSYAMSRNVVLQNPVGRRGEGCCINGLNVWDVEAEK